MPMRRYKPEQIVSLLRQVEVEIANGKTTPLWNYSGLGLETHDSAQYRVVKGRLQHSKKPVILRDLNKDHNHDLIRRWFRRRRRQPVLEVPL
jgi:hypothetical protein